MTSAGLRQPLESPGDKIAHDSGLQRKEVIGLHGARRITGDAPMAVKSPPRGFDSVGRDVSPRDAPDGQHTGIRGAVGIDGQVVAAGLTPGAVEQPLDP